MSNIQYINIKKFQILTFYVTSYVLKSFSLQATENIELKLYIEAITCHVNCKIFGETIEFLN